MKNVELLDAADTTFRRIADICTLLRAVDPENYPFEYDEMLELIADMASKQSEVITETLLRLAVGKTA